MAEDRFRDRAGLSPHAHENFFGYPTLSGITWLIDAKPVPIMAGYFFSITHCRGCWCLRAKSITCVTLVSAIS